MRLSALKWVVNLMSRHSWCRVRCIFIPDRFSTIFDWKNMKLPGKIPARIPLRYLSRKTNYSLSVPVQYCPGQLPTEVIPVKTGIQKLSNAENTENSGFLLPQEWHLIIHHLLCSPFHLSYAIEKKLCWTDVIPGLNWLYKIFCKVAGINVDRLINSLEESTVQGIII